MRSLLVPMLVNSAASSQLLLRNCPPIVGQSSQRHLFKWLNIVFNKVDKDKIKELGPDVAAAEWLIRNGAGVRWSKTSDSANLDTDYDKLSQKRSDQIVEIDATDSSISDAGFEYLKNLQSLEKLVLKNTNSIEDRALELLAGQCRPPSLRHLEVIGCCDVTDTGVLALKTLNTLNFLKLENLNSVQNKQTCLEELQKSLQSCKLIWN